jgi:membrane protein required for colicin V production
VNVVDWTAAFVVGWTALAGTRRGLVVQLAGLAALLGGLAAANRLAAPLGAAVGRPLGLAPPLDRYAGYVAAFVAFFATAAAVGRAIRARVRSGSLAPLDRAGGALLGAAKGVLVCYLLLYLVLCFPTRPLADALRRSVSVPLLLRALEETEALFPPEFQARGRECAEEAALVRASEPRTPPPAPEPCVIPPR